MSLFDLVEFTSFWSIWFWVIVVVSWSVTSHWTLGVPFDLILQADRKGGEWVDHCDRVARTNIFRLVYYFRNAGIALMTLAGFGLAAIGTLGFYANIEFFRAIFVLSIPHAVVGIFTVRLAFILDRQKPEPEALRKALKRRRFWTQFTGLIGIAFCAGVAVVEMAFMMGLV